MARKYSDVNLLTPSVNSWNNKADAEFIDYRDEEKAFHQGWENEREHPLDRVIINEFNRKNDTAIENVKVVYGPGSDEYTRNRHALALTIANAIYFRGGKYRPETEEGRKLLAHELTHVAQNKEKEAYRNVSSEDKEIEAEQNEDTQSYNPDKMIKKTVRGKKYRLKESVWKKIDSMAIRHLENKIEMLKNSLSEEEYLKLLCQYQKWQETRGLTWGIG